MTDQTITKPDVPKGPFLYQLAGMPEARNWAEGLVGDLKLYRAGKLDWSAIDSGCVLYGPPGTGKTTIARAIAASAEVPLIATSYAQWTKRGSCGADIIRGIQETFASANEHAPCVVAIDEFDSVPCRAELPAEFVGSVAIVNALLEQLDGLAKRKGVVVIAACNHFDRLDPALLRPGRLGRSILIPLPPIDAIPDILAFHLGEDRRRANLLAIAVMCAGMSPAEIEQVVRDARQSARRAGQWLEHRHLVGVLAARTQHYDADAIRRIAVHEAGHAVATYRCFPSQPVTASLLNRDLPIEHATPGDKPRTRQCIINQLVVLLAGRAAEKVILDEITDRAGGGRSSDLAVASKLARAAVGAKGLSELPVGLWYAETGSLPDNLANEASQFLADAHASAEALMQAERAFVIACAMALAERRALSYHDIMALDPRRHPPACAALTPPSSPHAQQHLRRLQRKPQ